MENPNSNQTVPPKKIVTLTLDFTDLDMVQAQDVQNILNTLNSVRKCCEKAPFLRDGLSVARAVMPTLEAGEYDITAGVIDSFFWDVDKMSELLK